MILATLLLHTTFVRSWCSWRASCVAASKKKMATSRVFLSSEVLGAGDRRCQSTKKLKPSLSTHSVVAGLKTWARQHPVTPTSVHDNIWACFFFQRLDTPFILMGTVALYRVCSTGLRVDLGFTKLCVFRLICVQWLCDSMMISSSESVLSKTAIFPNKEGRKHEISNESARGSSLREVNV